MTPATGEAAIRKRLQAIPNVGPRVADDLYRLGIHKLDDLKGRDGDLLYAEICRIDQVRHDPCCRDVFAAVIAIAEGHPPQPWYAFTAARKARDAK